VPSSNDTPGGGSTPVPPRGGKRKPNRPTGKVPASRSAGQRSNAGSRSGGSSRPAANNPSAQRRQAMAEQRRKRQTLWAVGAIVLVIVVVGVFVVVKVSGGGKTKAAASSKLSAGGSKAPAGAGVGDTIPSWVYSDLSGIKASSLQAAANNTKPADAVYPETTNDPPINKTGKPEVFYLGAEYCPYCATERWPMIVALSQFGTFKNLTSIASSPTDVYASTPSFAFYKSTYTSKYLNFTAVEGETVDEKTLQTPTAAQEKLVTKYDSGGSIPFVYFNGKAVIVGAEYDPNLLRKASFLDDVKSVAAGTSSLSTAVYWNAGVIVSHLCVLTKGQPGSVCKYFPKPITG
jgi:thiol-disulfide isomerase/thioredoxin